MLDKLPMNNENIIKFTSNRSFGVEFEINSFDNRDFKLNPLNNKLLELPLGIYEVGDLIYNKLQQKVFINSWGYTHNNKMWVLKPDRSCGIEICSPVSKINNTNKNYGSLDSICKVCDLLKEDNRIICNEKCSFHVHVNVKDCDYDVVSKILKYWIKFESVFLDSVPECRKLNKYCECIGLSSLFEYDKFYDSMTVIKKLGEHKYYTVNCFHLNKFNRNTIEFRIAENSACLDSFFVNNWVKLLIYFVESAKSAPEIELYEKDNYKTGLYWLDLFDLLEFLKFSNNYNISEEIQQIRNWFLSRIYKNVTVTTTTDNVWSYNTRTTTINQLQEIKNKWNIDFEKSLYG